VAAHSRQHKVVELGNHSHPTIANSHKLGLLEMETQQFRKSLSTNRTEIATGQTYITNLLITPWLRQESEINCHNHLKRNYLV